MRKTLPWLLVCLAALGALGGCASGRIYIEPLNQSRMVVGHVVSESESDVYALGGGADNFDSVIQIDSPAKLRGRRLEVMFADRANSTLPQLGSLGARIAFRVRAAALAKQNDFIYDSEITDAFNPDAIPPRYRNVEDLDGRVRIPRRRLPVFPQGLDAKFERGVSKFLVLVDEEGRLVEAIPFRNKDPLLEKATRSYLENARFAKGVFEGAPSAYFMFISIVYSK